MDSISGVCIVSIISIVLIIAICIIANIEIKKLRYKISQMPKSDKYVLAMFKEYDVLGTLDPYTKVLMLAPKNIVGTYETITELREAEKKIDMELGSSNLFCLAEGDLSDGGEWSVYDEE